MYIKTQICVQKGKKENAAFSKKCHSDSERTSALVRDIPRGGRSWTAEANKGLSLRTPGSTRTRKDKSLSHLQRERNPADTLLLVSGFHNCRRIHVYWVKAISLVPICP